MAFLGASKPGGLLSRLAWTTKTGDALIITCALSRCANACEKGNLTSLLWLTAELLIGILKLFVRRRFGEPKGARDLKQVCWVLANHVDQELKEVGGLGKEPAEIGPEDVSSLTPAHSYFGFLARVISSLHSAVQHNHLSRFLKSVG